MSRETFQFLSRLTFALTFVFGLLFCVSLANQLGGKTVIWASLLFAPVSLAALPAIGAVLFDDWLPLAVTYGGLILTFALRFLASRSRSKVQSPAPPWEFL